MSRDSRKIALATDWDEGQKDVIQKIKKYAEQGYTQAVILDLSKYFDTPESYDIAQSTEKRNQG